MDPGLRDLARELDCPSIELYTECQSMMAAITHSSEGKPRRIFDRAGGKEHTGIAMPGGHGQNFRILAPVYRKLYEQGIRYIWIGNIDNMGYTVDPVGLAIFALSGKDAVFEESFRTPMDVKGGILVCDRAGRLTCADIGPVISTQEMLAFEAAGKPVLFNCGIGLFDLEKLIARLPSIPYELPLRITDQDKDAGKYAQAEQITWEIIGLLDNPLFFAVEKNRRFIAAKMLLETILTSRPGTGPEGAIARGVHDGLVSLFASDYGLALKDGHWSLSV
jgi:UDP-N-acetylglucosamine pyrophosphorylase